MIGELLADPTSRLHVAIASLPDPVDPEKAAMEAEVTEKIAERYGL